MDSSTYEIMIEWPADGTTDSANSHYFERETVTGDGLLLSTPYSYEVFETKHSCVALRELFEGYMKDPIFRKIKEAPNNAL